MINEITITMLEKGMQEFGESRQSFSNSRIIQHLLGDEEENDDLQPMIIEQLIRVIALALFLFGSATAVFIGEIIVFRWKKWLDRKHRHRKFQINLKNCLTILQYFVNRKDSRLAKAVQRYSGTE